MADPDLETLRTLLQAMEECLEVARLEAKRLGREDVASELQGIEGQVGGLEGRLNRVEGPGN